MRKFLIFCLLSSAAAPIMARPDKDESRPARTDRSESRSSASSDSHPARVDRSTSTDRPRIGGGGSSERSHSSDGGPRERPNRAAFVDRAIGQVSSPSSDRPSSPVVERPAVQRDGNDTVRTWRPRDRGDGTTTPETRGRSRPDGEPPARTPRAGEGTDHRLPGSLGRRPGSHDDRRQSQPGDGSWSEHVRDRLEVSRVPRPGTQPPLRTGTNRGGLSHRWSRSWRDDRRYDWRHHRDRHRSTFHIGFYYDPFGWNYQRYNVGWRMWPSYYGRNYWLTDPGMYRLPPAYPGTQWIRYHDDAILVDMWTGEVLDVIYDFFW